MNVFRVIAKIVIGTLGATVGVTAVLIWGSQREYSVSSIVVASFVAASLAAIGAIQIAFPGTGFGVSKVKPASGPKGAIALSALCESLLVFNESTGASFEVDVVRQSGNIQRTVACQSADDAKKVVTSTFNRKHVEKVRIWRNDERCADVRINYYHGRGRAEGKVIAGIVVRRL
jgi:hypothetical protein